METSPAGTRSKFQAALRCPSAERCMPSYKSGESGMEVLERLRQPPLASAGAFSGWRIAHSMCLT
jgi:hypothetical protein